MGQYVVKRAVLTIPTLFLVALVTFAIVRMQSGDAITAMLGEAGTVSPEERARVERELGLDRPAPVQFAYWLSDVVRGDLGTSFYTRQPVSDLIMRRLPVSAQLAVGALLVALVIAIPIGAVAAYWRGSPIDYFARGFAVVGLSMPDFWFGLVVIILLITQFGWLPPLTYTPLFSDPVGNFQQFLFPFLIVGYRSSAVIMRMVRSATLEILNQDYVRTARAKGLTELAVIRGHVARNALIPVVTIVGLQIANLFNALVVIEILFGLPGVGSMTYNAALGRDYPVVQGAMLVLAGITVLANLLVDISYAILDPRIAV